MRSYGAIESTLRNAIAYDKLGVGVDVCKVCKQWEISMVEMKGEYGEPRIYKRHT